MLVYLLTIGKRYLAGKRLTPQSILSLESDFAAKFPEFNLFFPIDQSTVLVSDCRSRLVRTRGTSFRDTNDYSSHD